MKTYDLKTYDSVFGYSKFSLYSCSWRVTDFCECVSGNLVGQYLKNEGYYAYDKCLNCLGKGLKPIPWIDLK